MKLRTRLLISAGAIALLVAGVALATPVVGLNFANILASGTTTAETFASGLVKLPETSTEDQQDDDWMAKLITTGPTTFVVQDVSYFPGGHTGWHSHPGILLITVTEGSIEWYDSNCNRTVYTVGNSFTENTATHYFRNVGSINARVMVTYVLAPGQPRRIDQPAPACAAALGLN